MSVVSTFLNLKTIENIQYWWPGYHSSYRDFEGLDGPGNDSRLGQGFPCPTTLALRPTKPPVQWALGLSWVYSGQGVVLTTHPFLASRLQM